MFSAIPAFVILASLVAAMPNPAPDGMAPRDRIATWYNVADPKQNDGQEGGAVACSDKKYKDSEKFVALGKSEFKNGKSCDKWIWIQDDSTGKRVSAPVVDSCSSCKGGHIDLSPALWDELHNGRRGDGEIKISWDWAN